MRSLRSLTLEISSLIFVSIRVHSWFNHLVAAKGCAGFSGVDRGKPVFRVALIGCYTSLSASFGNLRGCRDRRDAYPPVVAHLPHDRMTNGIGGLGERPFFLGDL